ncbi:MAG: S8 family serine peptidase [Acidobacteriota bacterium]|jgi:subtilisin family serine protease
MIRTNLTLRGALAAALLLAVLLVLPGAAAAQSDYVLTAPHWGARQTAAVEAAGGTVLYGHPGTGIGLVTSAAPDFLERVLDGNAFQAGAPDVQVQWQPELPTEQAITPGDEPFFPLQWNVQSMEAPAAWAAGCTGAGVRVAILDGGIHDQHVDLDDNLDTSCSVSFVPGEPFNSDTGTFWHGTHVAGIVGAEDNGAGTIGVAPEATLLGVKVLHGGTGTFGWLIGGILYASDPASFGFGDCDQADIINMSLGAAFFKSATGGGQLVGALAQAVNFAASQGVLVVSAAGNNGLDFGQYFDLTFVPAESGSGLAISATGPVDFANGGTNFRRPASYSNYGEGTVTVAAPGGDFTLAPVGLWFYDMVLSTCRGGATSTDSYCFAAGTSMASPAAAGVAALIKGANPGISLGALKTSLQQSADDEGPLGNDEFYGHGFVNAYRACTE